jgi:CHAT domain-containing protein/tetratricopeptide (TPR) repeat protein
MPDPHLTLLGACPDLSSIAEYVDARLDASGRAAIQRHLASCDACTELVAEIVLTNEAGVNADAPSQPSQAASTHQLLPFRRRRIVVAGSLLAAAAVFALVARVWLRPEGAGLPNETRPAASRGPAPVDARLAGVVSALGDTRTVEGRLTGGFAYGRLRTPDRGGSATGNLALTAAAGELQKRANAEPTAANLHAWGVAQVLVGVYDSGVDTLESVWMQQKNARVAADLGAARLARADASGTPEDLPRALEALEQALTIEPDLAEAWFSKAIVLERLQIRQQAREAWTRYLQLDPDSEWSAEARRRLTALASPASARPWKDFDRALRDPGVSLDTVREAIQRDPMEVRELVVRDLLPAWAKTGADADLAHAAGVIEALEAPGPDRSLGRSIAEIRGAVGPRRAAIAAGLRELAAGLAAQSAERPVVEIRPHFDAALQQLRAGGSSLDIWAGFARTRLAVVAQQHDEVLAEGDDVRRRAERLGATAIAARAHWLLGMTAFTTNDWSAALAHYDEAIRLCGLTAEASLASSVHLNASVLNRFLGNVGATWRHRLAAAADIPRHRPVQLHTYLTSGSITASTESLPLTALLFQNEVVANAAESLPAAPRAEAAITRARMLARLGRGGDASADLESAEQLLKGLSSDALKRRLSRAWLLGSAEVRQTSDPARAARDAAEAVSLISAAGEPIRLAEASLLESRALSNLGRIDEARTAAGRGLDAFEQALGSIDPRDPIRISAVDPVWALYSDAARLHLRPGREDYAAAFSLLERGRARTLLDLRRVQPLALAEVRRRLRSDEAVLLLDQSSSGLVTWWITPGSVRTAAVPAPLPRVEALVASHRRAIDRGERRSAASAELFDLAIRGWWPELRNVATVAVIPDGAWSRVAWSALWDPSSQTELVSGAAIVVAPSASMALSARWDPGVPARRTIVVSAADGVNGAPLPAARREAKEISSLYHGARLLEKEEATPANVLRELSGADVVHVASHSVDVPGYPELSHLVLTGGPTAGRLLVRDIASRHLSKTRLVVLAGCSTAGRRTVRGEGTVGVAWGFLTAGARQVIGTLQDIEDGPAGALFVSVHRGIAAGQTPSRALHETQRQLAASGESPRVWATVAMFGAL